MASYALLNAFSGFQFDMVRGWIGFDPIQLQNSKFRCFWSLDSGWGEFEMQSGQFEIRLAYGQLNLHNLSLPLAETIQAVTVDGEPVPFSQATGEIHFLRPVCVRKGQTLQVTV